MDAPGSGSGLVSRRIFVGSVSFSSTNESIAAFFGQFGPVETAEIICDPHTGRSRGFAFVTFGDDGSCARALLDRAPTVDGRTVDVKPAMTRQAAPPPVVPRAPHPPPHHHYQQGAERPHRSSGPRRTGYAAPHADFGGRGHPGSAFPHEAAPPVAGAWLQTSAGFVFVPSHQPALAQHQPPVSSAYASAGAVYALPAPQPPSAHPLMPPAAAQYATDAAERLPGKPEPSTGLPAAAAAAASEGRRVFVGGLSFAADDACLAAHFAAFGPVLSAEVQRNHTTGRSRGFAFVTFADADSAARAMAEPRQSIAGRLAELAPQPQRHLPPHSAPHFASRAAPAMADAAPAGFGALPLSPAGTAGPEHGAAHLPPGVWVSDGAGGLVQLGPGSHGAAGGSLVMTAAGPMFVGPPAGAGAGVGAAEADAARASGLSYWAAPGGAYAALPAEYSGDGVVGGSGGGGGSFEPGSADGAGYGAAASAGFEAPSGSYSALSEGGPASPSRPRPSGPHSVAWADGESAQTDVAISAPLASTADAPPPPMSLAYSGYSVASAPARFLGYDGSVFAVASLGDGRQASRDGPMLSSDSPAQSTGPHAPPQHRSFSSGPALGSTPTGGDGRSRPLSSAQAAAEAAAAAAATAEAVRREHYESMCEAGTALSGSGARDHAGSDTSGIISRSGSGNISRSGSGNTSRGGSGSARGSGSGSVLSAAGSGAAGSGGRRATVAVAEGDLAGHGSGHCIEEVTEDDLSEGGGEYPPLRLAFSAGATLSASHSHEEDAMPQRRRQVAGVAVQGRRSGGAPPAMERNDTDKTSGGVSGGALSNLTAPAALTGRLPPPLRDWTDHPAHSRDLTQAQQPIAAAGMRATGPGPAATAAPGAAASEAAASAAAAAAAAAASAVAADAASPSRGSPLGKPPTPTRVVSSRTGRRRPSANRASPSCVTTLGDEAGAADAAARASPLGSMLRREVDVSSTPASRPGSAGHLAGASPNSDTAASRLAARERGESEASHLSIELLNAIDNPEEVPSPPSPTEGSEAPTEPNQSM
ncbi:hypothetical protein FNF29_07093 [Cafeteria roenbergensis]|uniref:RRM domain-containing protein n=1 Tax=Cafeteria roenbergensis TaxID=33653 RepID=A0A5A8C6Z9_CAFRO|nr:hypothetical protein FNF29_07093 [Cafeteria roenbergensis]|eukprot:KAA0147880.1 hypothetical protein FNF29_07093 [Cafeteria roenbergensis]